jgi:hypothetical protein
MDPPGFWDMSVLKPEGSVISGIAVSGSVFAVYRAMVGPVSQVHMSPANVPAVVTSRNKAGYTSFLLVSALTLITRDGNIGTLGYGSIIAMELAYRHAEMVNPDTGQMEPSARASQMPANIWPTETVTGQNPALTPQYDDTSYGY